MNVRFLRLRPRRLYTWLLLAVALMLAPQFVGAAVGITAQQRKIDDSREAANTVAGRLARIARVQATLDDTQDLVLRLPAKGDAPAGPRVRASLARAHADVAALDSPADAREFARLETQAAGELSDARSVQRLTAPLSRLRSGMATLSRRTVSDMRTQQADARADQHSQLLGILIAFAATLILTLLIARVFVGSIRKPLRTLRSSAHRLGSGDLAHRVELDSFTELNEVADAFNAMVDALRRSGHELTRRAFHDPLTGLANRALLVERISHALEQPERGSIGVLLIDLDDFKAINDSLGLSRGDEVLIEVGHRLRGVLRPSDTVARLGGDEFAVLLEDLTDRRGSIGAAERILLALATPLTIAGGELHAGASIGAAVSTEQLCDADELLRAADLAMYAAKSGGKSCYRSFEPTMLSGTVERLALERDLKRAIELDEIEVHYQPVVDMATGRVRGVEALARWRHPERGRIVPDVFIPLAEQSGQIVPLGRKVLARACTDLPTLRAGLNEPNMIVSVNLSAAELLEPALPDHVLASTAAAGITPSSLIIEITETQLMSDLEAGIARLHELRALGVNLALDDFGTGYSSLAYLSSFPIGSVKIDRSFVGHVADPASDDHVLVRAIISLGQTLDLRIVAEGIEDEDQRRELVRLGCDRGQGYLFSRPLPASELILNYGRGPVLRYS